MSLVALHPEMASGERFDHLALNLNEIVSCHGAIRISMRTIFVDIQSAAEIP
jgi:hypothetical protein